MKKGFVAAILVALCFVSACNRDPEAAKRKYIESGNKYFEKGNYKAAWIMYQKALKRDLKFGEGHYRSALAELKLQRFGDAARSLQRAVELQSTNKDALNRLTNLYLNVYLSDRRRPKQVLEELKTLSDRYTERFPNSYEQARLKGYLGLFEGNAPEALTWFEKANSLKPFEEDLILIYFQTLIANNRAAEGEKLAHELLQRNPAAMSVYDALFLYYARQNRPEDAERILKLKVEKNPKISEARLQLAAHYYTRKQRDQMMGVLSQITSNPSQFPDGAIQVGDFFLRTREYDLAAQQYTEGMKRATQAQAKSAYQKRMVEVLVKQDRKDEANRVIADVLKENPKDSEAIAMRASLSLLTGTKDQLQSAVNDLQTVVNQMPNNAVVRYNLGRALIAKGNVQQGRVQLEEAVKLQPDYLLPRLTLAQLQIQSREYGKVLQMTKEALAFDPGNLAARLLRSRALVGLGDLKQAREELEGVTRDYPDAADAQLQLGALDLQARNFKAAEEAFRKLHARTQDSRAFIGLIETYLAQGQKDTGVRMLREELAKAPQRAEYHVALANISVTSGDYKTAIDEYHKVLEKAPNNAQLWLQLAETHRRAGDLGQAVAGFKKAAELSPTDVRAPIQLALLYDISGQKQQAKPFYEQALRLEPDHPIALNNLAYMLAESGSDLDQALTMAQRATRQRPNDGNIADTLGWIYIKKNLSDSAINIYRKLVEQDPNRSLYRYHLAMALLQKGDKTQARKECEAALKTNPAKDEEAKIRELMAKLG